MLGGALPAQAAAPVVSVTATPGTFKATIAYRIDRGAAKITGQRCWLTNPAGVKSTTPCDPTPNANSTATSTRYSVSLPLLTKAGKYTFKVRFSVVGGLTASASSTFTIKPGPAVKLTMSGIRDQDFACVTDSICNDNTYGPDFPRQLARVVARDQYGNIAKGYTGTVAMERRGGDFPPGIYPPDAKLYKGVGYFPFVAPQAPSAQTTGPCATSDWLLHVLVRFYDKDDPSIQDTCRVIRVRFIVSDPAPDYVKVSPPGCVGPCFESPIGDVVVDEGVGPTTLVSPPTDWNAPPGTFIVQGREVGGTYFAQVIQFDARMFTVDGGDLGLPVAACPGCDGTNVWVDVVSTQVDEPFEIHILDVNLSEPGPPLPDSRVRDPVTGEVGTPEELRAKARDRLCPVANGQPTFFQIILTTDLSKCLRFN